LLAHVGWRGTCFAYAAILLTVVLPLYLLGLPREPRREAGGGDGAAAPAGRLGPGQRLPFLLLAAALTLAYVIMTVIAVELIALFQAFGLTMAAAVGLGALLGPSQVGGRLLEMLFGRKTHPLWSMLASTILVPVGLALLATEPAIAAVGIMLYGAGSGIRSIVRGTVPLALFGADGYAIIMGRLGLPTLVAQAISPAVGALLMARMGAQATLAVLCAAGVANMALVLLLVAVAIRHVAPADFHPGA
jgi:hypothetical protein